MSGAEILSLVGIIIGLAVLVVLVMKGCFRSNEFI